MPPRLRFFSASLRGSVLRASNNQSTLRLSPGQFLCQTCQRKFSTSPIRRAVQKAAEPKGKYKSRLLIYDAGDARTTWVSFWKAVALLQFGTTLVFFVPPLWKNENQPDPNVRRGQAILVGLLGTIPTLTLAYVTAPFVHQVFMQIPEHARRSRADLMRFVQTLNGQKAASANTKLEFVTLRIFPFRKNTAMFLHELRALPPRRLRIANIELPKSDAWAKRQREKGIFRRMLEVINEPRFKFYVKEGRMYTMKTSAPGVWEEVAKRIQEQTKEAEADASAPTSRAKRPVLRPIAVPRPVPKPVAPVVKRQTARGPKK